ncbi:MAG: acyl-CoA desaturase [Cryomorphaceae bacterium]|nr:acyl-CoA desaturase [Cryomorphaceae bacterium]
MSQITFERAQPNGFYRTLRSRVLGAIKESGNDVSGGSKIQRKAIILAAIYVVPIVAMYFVMPVWLYFLMWILAGVGMSGIGMGIMHDANHGSFSKNPTLNKLLGSSIVLLCGHTITWKIQHNILHHTYTNIHGKDEDIDTSAGIIRLHPEQPRRKLHKYQHLYGPLLYSLMTLNWLAPKDFKQLVRFQKAGLLKQAGGTYTKEWWKLVLNKITYTSVMVIIPIIFHPQAWFLVILGFIAMHFVAGSLLSWTFQLAHAMPATSKFDGIKNDKFGDWATHQLLTTINFARNNKLVTWFLGGLNYQVEHHLFPNISHVHYPKIAEIVKQTALEFNLPYQEIPRLRDAIKYHFHYLQIMGGSRPEVA